MNEAAAMVALILVLASWTVLVLACYAAVSLVDMWRNR